jgi:hypothetical protein
MSPAIGLLAFVFSAELVIGAHGIAAIDSCWSTSNVDGEGDGFEDFLPRSAVLVRHLRVVGNTAIAMDRDADRERHQLLGLGIDGVRRGGGNCQ